jgi:hypothetical protein
MSKFITLYIYAIFEIFCIIYDAFLSNDINYITYNKRNNEITVLNVIGIIFYGLTIYLASYSNFNILAWVLVLISVVSKLSVIICDALRIDLYLDYMCYSPENKENR